MVTGFPFAVAGWGDCRFLVEKASASGGHLGPNPGVVEFTLALHRVFDSPHDALVFDTGHQTYVHNLLTGRRKVFDSLRRREGLSGYPSTPTRHCGLRTGDCGQRDRSGPDQPLRL
jgi:hypothetical protein